MGPLRRGVLVATFVLLSCNLVEGQAAPREETDADKQKKTITDVRNLGTALFSWLTDQVGAAAAGENLVNLNDYPLISEADLEKLLVPTYLEKVPKLDGWGHPYEVRLNVKDPQSRQVIAIRSPGRDGKFSGDTYSVGGFDPQSYDEDIAWVDGYFLRWPEKPKGGAATP